MIKKIVATLFCVCIICSSAVTASAATYRITMDNDAAASNVEHPTWVYPYESYIMGVFGSWSYVTGSNHYNNDARLSSYKTQQNDLNTYAWKYTGKEYTKHGTVARLSVYLNDSRFDGVATYLNQGKGGMNANYGRTEFGTIDQNKAPGGWSVISWAYLNAPSFGPYVVAQQASYNRIGADAVYFEYSGYK